MNPAPTRTFALVGPGRAGMSLALGLVARGWRAVGVAGRAVGAPSTRAAVARLACPPVSPAGAGAGATLVLVATPDGALDHVGAEIAPGLEPGALVLHCSGARGLDALEPVVRARPDVAVGALHPLQTFPVPDPGRLAGAWAAVAGPPAVAEIALELGMAPVVVPDERRAAYHAAAAVAANHLVALLGQVARLAAAADVPADAFWPLVHATVDNVQARGAPAALTGPVVRGDLGTVAAHLASLPDEERDAYCALALAALALTRRDDPALRDLLHAARREVLA